MTKPIEVRNPRTGKLDYEIVPPSENLLEQQCTHLRQGQKHWQQIGIEGRIEALQQWKQAILSQRGRLTEALVNDTGRLSISVLEIDSFLSGIDRWCKLAPELLLESHIE